MSLDTLRKYNSVDFEGLLLNAPLLLFEYYMLATLSSNTQIIFLVLLLLVLGVLSNRYSGAIALFILSYLAYVMNVRALLFASMWLIGIVSSKKTGFLDRLLSYMFILIFNAVLVSSNEHIYFLVSMIPALLYLSRNLENRPTIYLSLSLLFVSAIILLSKITNSILSLNLFAFVIAFSIYLAYKTISLTTEA